MKLGDERDFSFRDQERRYTVVRYHLFNKYVNEHTKYYFT